MARPRTPTSILAARGGLDKPGRAAKREGEPEVVGEIGDPPDYFTEPSRQAWYDIVEAMHAGTYGRAERLSVEVAALLLTKIRRMGPAVDGQTVTRFQAFLSSSGMTPCDRSKISVAHEPEEENPLGALIKRPGLRSV